MKKQPTKLPRGRPPKSDDERADERLGIRLMAGDKAAWQEAAGRAEMPLSAWIRDRLDKAAKREASKG